MPTAFTMPTLFSSRHSRRPSLQRHAGPSVVSWSAQLSRPGQGLPSYIGAAKTRLHFPVTPNLNLMRIFSVAHISTHSECPVIFLKLQVLSKKILNVAKGKTEDDRRVADVLVAFALRQVRVTHRSLIRWFQYIPT